MAKCKLISVEAKNVFLDSRSKSESYLLRYEKKVWWNRKKTIIIENSVNVPHRDFHRWHSEMISKIGVWRNLTPAKESMVEYFWFRALYFSLAIVAFVLFWMRANEAPEITIGEIRVGLEMNFVLSLILLVMAELIIVGVYSIIENCAKVFYNVNYINRAMIWILTGAMVVVKLLLWTIILMPGVKH